MEKERERNKRREDGTLGLDRHGCSRRKISQQARQRGHRLRSKERAEQVQGSTGWVAGGWARRTGQWWPCGPSG